MFLIYLLLYLIKPPNSHRHKKSHGSAFLRQGAAVFGAGTTFYFVINLASYIINMDCVGPVRNINAFLALLFTILQVCFLDFKYLVVNVSCISDVSNYLVSKTEP